MRHFLFLLLGVFQLAKAADSALKLAELSSKCVRGYASPLVIANLLLKVTGFQDGVKEFKPEDLRLITSPRPAIMPGQFRKPGDLAAVMLKFMQPEYREGIALESTLDDIMGCLKKYELPDKIAEIFINKFVSDPANSPRHQIPERILKVAPLFNQDLQFLSGKLLGDGGFSEVHDGQLFSSSGSLGPVACKHPFYFNEQQMPNEILALHLANGSLNIVGFKGAKLDPDNPERAYLFMEVLDGADLEKLVGSIPPIPLNLLGAIVRQVLQGFSHLHGLGIKHMDLKPSNIFITRAGQVKIIDFDGAFIAHYDRMTSRTPYFQAPEQAQERPCSEKTDIYLVGMLLTYLMTEKKAASLSNTSSAERFIAECKAEVGKISQSARAFVSLAMHNDPFDWATLDQLFAHPFIQSEAASDLDLQEYLKLQLARIQ